VTQDRRAFSPSTARNREPILAVLRRVLPANARVLEIASGSGEHAMFMARAMPKLTWQPSDPESSARESIADWIAHEGLDNVLPPLAIDVRAEDWGAQPPVDAIVAINMIHYSPWESTPALFTGAARLLREGGIVFLYGPYKRDGRHTAPSNEAFEEWLKARDPSFGVRDLSDVEREAVQHGFALHEIVEMPANNLSLVFAKR
jgi:cyclopropane fatty-acyl-phospholipid synthase-like methyltransferase